MAKTRLLLTLRPTQVYTSLALLAAVPRIGSHFYDTQRWAVAGATHEVVGATGTAPGARNVAELRLFLCRLILKGVLMNASWFDDAGAGSAPLRWGTMSDDA